MSLGCGLGPLMGACESQQIYVSLPLFLLPFPLSKKQIKSLRKKKKTLIAFQFPDLLLWTWIFSLHANKLSALYIHIPGRRAFFLILQQSHSNISLSRNQILNCTETEPINYSLQVHCFPKHTWRYVSKKEELNGYWVKTSSALNISYPVFTIFVCYLDHKKSMTKCTEKSQQKSCLEDISKNGMLNLRLTHRLPMET